MQICDVAKTFTVVRVCSEYMGPAYQRESTHESAYKEESTAHNPRGAVDRGKLTVAKVTAVIPKTAAVIIPDIQNSCLFSRYSGFLRVAIFSELCKFILCQSTPFFAPINR